uniref:Uncharacterized protein n=1 Tax=Nelumbo nucifera TaxID=4432 RepID=A0A822Z1T4_NELNU|nr:TPA_asm: hypothetical protein HUJ06_007607 [Nelumbo nucifera]
MDYFMITTEELKSFHAIDREIFSRLVINLRRDVAVSMRVIAFWIWLEELGYPNIILKMLPLPDSMVNVLAEEAASCLNYVSVNVTRPSSRNSNDTPLTSGLMNRNISFQLVHERRISAVQAITKTVNDVLARAFEDIAQQARASGSSGSGRNVVAGESSLNPRAQPWKPNAQVSHDDRTIFITFSRGYPVGESEIRGYFIRRFGECVEAIHMQEVAVNVQPLYARMVLRSASTMARILEGRERAKYVINGKHVWIRRFVPRQQMRSSLRP